ncbi:MAG: GspE/PulE family protein [Brevinematia bacterium]
MAFGDLIVKLGIITQEELLGYLQKQKITKKRLGELLIEDGKITEKELYDILSNQFNVKFDDNLQLDDISKVPLLISLLPLEFCKKKNVAPLNIKDDFIVVAIDNPSDFDLLNEIRFITGKHVEVKYATTSAIKNYIAMLQDVATGKGVMSYAVSDSSTTQTQVKPKGNGERVETKGEKDESKIVKLVNKIILEGIERKASDIHLEVYEKSTILRYRIDGKLYNFDGPSIDAYPSVVSRIKIMSNLDISERRLPQDGSIKFSYMDKEVDIRVSVIPGIFGENIVMRILSKDASIISSISTIGMDEFERKLYENALTRPNGMILVTGPTGSGKTTTLYAGIMYLKKFNKKIITAEDPVEYQIEGVEQVQINSDIGFTFANALRAFLRHDPDVIMVGEIRDTETAEIAIRAALTGHLVLSTLHTNDAVSSITRLVDMGIPPYLVVSTVNLVISQRLVRKLCDHCKIPKKLDSLKLDKSISKYFSANDIIYYPNGCPKCGKTGFSGRIPIFEILEVDDDIKEKVLDNSSSFELKQFAIGKGMKTLRDSGMEKVRKGLTTIEEVMSVS